MKILVNMTGVTMANPKTKGAQCGRVSIGRTTAITNIGSPYVCVRSVLCIIYNKPEIANLSYPICHELTPLMW